MRTSHRECGALQHGLYILSTASVIFTTERGEYFRVDGIPKSKIKTHDL